MTSQRGNGRGPPEGLEQRVVGQVLGNATGGTKSPCHLADPWIERVHNDADLWEPIPKDRRDRKTVGTRQGLVDHQHLRLELAAQLDALATVRSEERRVGNAHMDGVLESVT